MRSSLRGALSQTCGHVSLEDSTIIGMVVGEGAGAMRAASGHGLDLRCETRCVQERHEGRWSWLGEHEAGIIAIPRVFRYLAHMTSK